MAGGDFDIGSFLDDVPIPKDEEPIVAAGVEHVPVVFLLDTSGSMGMHENAGSDGVLPIDQLNACLKEFFSDVINEKTPNDRIMKHSADFCIIEYNSEVNVVLRWKHGSQITEADIPHLTAGGGTATYSAIQAAAQELLVQFKKYNEEEVSGYAANLFHITDGGPTEKNQTSIDRAKRAVSLFTHAGTRENPYGVFYHIGVKGYQRQPLLELAQDEEHVIGMGDKSISEVFQFIRASLDPSQLKRMDSGS